MLNSTSVNDTATADEKRSLTTVVTTACVLPLCVLSFVLNTLALVLLKRKKKFHKNKFYCLILCLSLSDIVFSVTCFAIVFDVFLQALGVDVPFLCFGGLLTTSIAITFSWIQVLFVCIERLLATLNYNRIKNWKRKYLLMYILSFVVTSLFVISLFIVFGKTTPSTCGLRSIFLSNYSKFQAIRSFVHFTLYCCILCIYLIVIQRLRTRMLQVNTTTCVLVVHVVDMKQACHPTRDAQCKKQIKGSYKQHCCNTQKQYGRAYEHCSSRTSGQCNSSNTSGQSTSSGTYGQSSGSTSGHTCEKLKTSNNFDIASRQGNGNCGHTDSQKTTNGLQHRAVFFRRSIATVGIVIVFASISMLPSVICNAVSGLTNGQVISYELLELTNTLVFINPLFNPLIYVLRIKEFRSIMKCQC